VAKEIISPQPNKTSSFAAVLWHLTSELWTVNMNAILILINSIIDIYIFSLLAYVIASWLVSFKIINPWQPFVRVLLQSLSRLHEPLLSRIRSVLPELGGIDLSPIIVFLAVQFLRNLMLEYTQ